MGKLRKLCTAYPPRKVYAAAVMKLSTEHDYHRPIARVIEAIPIDPARRIRSMDWHRSRIFRHSICRHRSTPGAQQECVTDLLIPIRRR
jgi:hypothetical protein